MTPATRFDTEYGPSLFTVIHFQITSKEYYRILKFKKKVKFSPVLNLINHHALKAYGGVVV
jgi:hypothetical protein